MVGIQLIEVLETSNCDKSDDVYVNEVIKRFFEKRDINNAEINIQQIFLNGKHKYKTCLKRIENYIRMYKKNTGGESVVVYFIDTDSTEQNYKPGSFFSNVRLFCEQNNFELVWFCRTAENVFIGRKARKGEGKTRLAFEYANSGCIYKMDKTKLEKSKIELGCSNILSVLKKYLKPKIKS